MGQYNNRYEKFEINETQYSVPFIKLPPKSTDLFIQYNATRSRLDKISEDAYQDPYHGWLILLANPEYGGLEFNIPDGTMLRVPFPLLESMTIYNELINRHKQLYG